IQILENGDCFARLARSLVRTSEVPFHVCPWRLPVFFQKRHCLCRPILLQQGACIHHVSVFNQQRVRIFHLEIAQCCQRLQAPARLHVSRAQVICDVFAQIARVHLRPLQRGDRLQIVVIQRIRIPKHQPGQRSRVFVVMPPRVTFHPGVGRRSAVRQQLSSHGPQIGGLYKCLVNSPRSPRTHLLLLFLFSGSRSCSPLASSLRGGNGFPRLGRRRRLLGKRGEGKQQQNTAYNGVYLDKHQPAPPHTTDTVS